MEQERLSELAEEFKEHARQALYHQQEAYFRMAAILEYITTGDMAEVERICDVIKTLTIL